MLERMKGSRFFFFVLLALVSLVTPSGATWSIVVVNARTGEVGVASATCLANFNLRRWTPVIVIGRGAASAQGIVDTTGANRRLIRNGLRDGIRTDEILDMLGMSDPIHPSRVYGIVSIGHGSTSVLGTQSQNGRHALTGQVGDYIYAIQGSGLTGAVVVLATEAAFVQESGDMSQRMLAGLQAGKRFGGDGRCSCAPQAPTSCGAPPPGFLKSGHCGYVIVARHGDTTGSCGSNGCAQGDYYLTLNIQGPNAAVEAPDPVDQLQARYDVWRERQADRPDGVLSSVSTVGVLPANGHARRTVKIVLRDIDERSLTTGGALVSVQPQAGSGSLVEVSAIRDHGGGSYSFKVTAGSKAGTERLVITVDDGLGVATLYPYTEITLSAPAAPFAR